MARTRRWPRPLGVAAFVGVLAWRVGPAALGDALRDVDARALAVAAVAALAVAAVSTLCVAWRWVLVARGLGLELSLPEAVRASYRAQLLNVSLPLGVAGDVHRAVSHGRSAGDVSRGVRAVVWERTAGQVVQVVLALGVLLAVPSPLRSVVTDHAAVLGTVALAFLLGAGGVLLIRLRHSTSRAAGLARTVVDDVRHGLLARRIWPGVVAASALAVLGHVLTFLVAMRASIIAISPHAHARAASIASRGRRSEGCSASKRCSTCSAHAAAHSARRRWSPSSSSPPRRIVTSRGSRTSGRIMRPACQRDAAAGEHVPARLR